MKIFDELFERDEQGSALGRHSLMLGSLVLLLVALPAFEWIPGRGLRFPLLFGLVMISAIYMNRTQSWILWAGTLVGGSGLVALVLANATGSTAMRITSELLGLTLLATTTLVLLNTLVKTRQVMLDTVVGGVCVYLLIGLCFALLYRLIVDVHPGAFLMDGVAVESSIDDASSLSVRLLYFSFVTLTTVGFGDILPDAELAQMLVVGEAIIGQLYLTIFIARLMALYVMGGPAAKSE